MSTEDTTTKAFADARPSVADAPLVYPPVAGAAMGPVLKRAGLLLGTRRARALLGRGGRSGRRRDGGVVTVMAVQESHPAQRDDVLARPVTEPRQYGFGFWAVAFALMVVMASATLPSPLYGLYRVRDHFSTLMVTVVYAIFAGGTIGSLLSVPFIVPRVGRRGVMLGAVATMMVASGLLAAWKVLPGLLIGRCITGVAVGLAAGTATVYLIELRARAKPDGSPIRAQTVGTAVLIGSLGLGPLIAGCLAEWVQHPLTLPFLLFVALGAIALIGLAVAPETGAPAPAASATAQVGGPSRSTKVLVPGTLAIVAAYAAGGLFAGLSGLFLATILHHPSHALSGATLCLVFCAGVVALLATSELRPSRVLALGTISMLVGLALLVTAVLLSTPSLLLFLFSGALIGAGAGTVFKGTTGLVLGATAPEQRLATTSDLLIATYVGLSIPVIGAGIALNWGASAPDTVLGFAILVGLGVAGAGAFLGRVINNKRASVADAAAPSAATSAKAGSRDCRISSRGRG